MSDVRMRINSVNAKSGVNSSLSQAKTRNNDVINEAYGGTKSKHKDYLTEM